MRAKDDTKEKKEKAVEDECEADDLKGVTFGALLTGALALAVALAWNDAMQRLITYFSDDPEKRTPWAGFGYAILLTLIVIIVIWIIRKVYDATRSARCRLAKKTSGLIAL